MESSRQPRLRVWTPLLFAAIMVLGMSLGFKLHDSLRNKRDLETVVQRNDRLETIIDLINERYVDTINTNALYSDAVKGILTHLDPHTVYIPADQLASVNEGLQGSFFGIGISYLVLHDTMVITAVVPEGPAAKAGVKTGDKLIKVSDTLVAGVNIPTGKVVNMLRGEQKSAVRIGLKDIDNGREKDVSITRDDVPIYSVDAGIMLDKITGYIKVNRFAATTYNEFASALKKLKKEGLRQLIIDLRGNPGGYLDAATNIADELLDGERPIVFTQGVHSEKVEYKTDKDGMFEQGKLIVLVDENAASAAEILAGAVQDWDRGVIMGRRTFGKGLVQEQYDLDDGSALRLTIAHYYTPSGRSIQRSYDKGKDAYEAAFEDRYKSGEFTGKDSVAKEDTMAFYTSTRRIVRGGGGIKPDVYVPYDSVYVSSPLVAVLLSDGLQNAVIDYFITHYAQLKHFKHAAELTKGFTGDQDILDQYVRQLSPTERQVVISVLGRKVNRDFLLLQIKAQLARVLFRDNGYYAISNTGDIMVQRALKLFNNEAAYLKLIGR